MQGKADSVYIAIDLKSFYASVECVDRGLDPLTTNLVVADKSRSAKTICLAVSPALKLPNFGCKTASAKIITASAMELFDRIANPDLLVRRLTMSVNGVVSQETMQAEQKFEQLDLFTDYAAEEKKQEELKRKMRIELAMVRMRRKYGKNALLKGMDFLKEATGRDRNEPIGGHRVWQTAKHSLHHDTLLLKKNRSGQKEKGKRMDDKKWKTDMLKYKDMFDLARPEPIRPRMPVADRAAQFAPFAALTNFGEEIQKVTERVNGEEGSSNA